jgi:CubicO group peptidase (beta-lactamase class C family)
MRLGIRAIVCGLAAALFAAPSLAQGPTPLVPQAVGPAPAIAPASAPGAQPAALTASDLQAWLDGYMPYAIGRGDIAGAVVVVVKGGQVLLQKGYGYADVAKRQPIDPATTLFRPGSVSKLFTWTAVMQQVEQGKINLDQDVHTYLDFKIPAYQGRPVTMRNLMTHTGGFEEDIKNLLTYDPKGAPPLEQVLKADIPARIFPPGQVPAYSNFGAALAGYIVQRVSGQPFDAYVEQHIFAPLGMTHATFRQPLPQALRPLMAHGYLTASSPASDYEMIGLAPAGSSAVSGGDMAHFMIAHLQDGAYEGNRILQPATAQMMHGTPLTTISPQLHRMLLGFYEADRNGHRIIAHAGDLRVFHSDLELFLDDHVGLFISLNSPGKEGAAGAVRSALFNGFADRYFPGPAAHGSVSPDQARVDGALLARGSYESSRRPETNFLSLLSLMQTVKVSVDKDGRITSPAVVGLNGEPRRFEEIAPFVWREVNGKDRLAAKVVDGRVALWAEDEESPFMVFTPEHAWRDGAWLWPLTLVSIAALLWTALLWPVSALVRRRYGGRFALERKAALSHRLVRVGAAAAGLLMATWLVTEVVMLQTFALTSSLDPWILLLHLLSIAVFPLALAAAVWNVWVVWRSRRGWRSAFARFWSVVLTVGCLTVCWVGLAFHLIGLGLTY